MTTTITITNQEDSADAAARWVVVKQLNADGTPMPGAPDVELAGGDSIVKHVHSGNQIVVTEKAA